MPRCGIRHSRKKEEVVKTIIVILSLITLLSLLLYTFIVRPKKRITVILFLFVFFLGSFLIHIFTLGSDEEYDFS